MTGVQRKYYCREYTEYILLSWIYRVNITATNGVQRKHYRPEYANTTAMTGVQRKH